MEKAIRRKKVMKMKLAVFALSVAPIFAQSPGPTMKAIVAHQWGGPEALKGTLLTGKYAKIFGTQLPWTPGYDIAGTVEKVGANVSKFQAGDSIYAFISISRGGGYAEYALAKENEAALKPTTLSFAEAAGVPSVALTAWQALVDKANVQADQTVLIQGASGGVGTFAIPIAKLRGAKVFATASTANQDFLKQLGADVAIDYKTQKFEDIAKNVDVVVDGVGGETLKRSYPIVKKGGILVALVGRVDQAELDKYGIRGVSLEAEYNGDQLAEIGKLIDAKKIKVVVSETFPLADAATALTKANTRHARGKIVLKVRDEPN
jgi:NADPH:quinone reductase-like Zn-dependent oxidoreductase